MHTRSYCLYGVNISRSKGFIGNTCFQFSIPGATLCYYHYLDLIEGGSSDIDICLVRGCDTTRIPGTLLCSSHWSTFTRYSEEVRAAEIGIRSYRLREWVASIYPLHPAYLLHTKDDPTPAYTTPCKVCGGSGATPCPETKHKRCGYTDSGCDIYNVGASFCTTCKGSGLILDSDVGRVPWTIHRRVYDMRMAAKGCVQIRENPVLKVLPGGKSGIYGTLDTGD
jgi:hypothetical protein